MGHLFGLYVITDEKLCPGRTHAEIAKAAIEGGARIIQIRDKFASDRKFYQDAMRIREITEAAGVMFFINDRIDIAAAVGADGVNVGQSDMPVEIARGLLGEKVIIGVSADCLEQAQQAQNDGADYIGFGPVFPTITKADAGPVSGLDKLRRVCHEVSLPVVAIGGIGIDNIGSVAANGAACAAVISAVVCAEDMTLAAAELVKEFQQFVGW
ncbi:MAG: thiamine phosphate synthase [Armatimonadetes bacterium]|nr:thiamine phosphate synthase [Armatimonadota bacterium]